MNDYNNYMVVADNDQVLERNLYRGEAIKLAVEMKRRYPESDFYICEQD